jgi:hypothetical protein
MALRMTTQFGTLVVDVTEENLRGSKAFDYLRELVTVPARRMVLQLAHVSDDVLPRVATFMRYLATRRSVTLCGIRRGQVARLTSLGIDPDRLLVGNWPRRAQFA